MNEGDHICLLRVKIPTKLTTEQRTIFKELAKIEEKVIPENEENSDEK